MGKEQREGAGEAAVACGGFAGNVPAHNDTLPTLGIFFYWTTKIRPWIQCEKAHTVFFLDGRNPFWVLQLAMNAELRITGDKVKRLGLCGGGGGCWAEQTRACSSCTKCRHASPASNASPSSSRHQVAERGGKSFCSCAVCNPRPVSHPGASHVWGIGIEKGEKGSGILLGPCLRFLSLHPRCFPSHLCLFSLAKRVWTALFWTIYFFLKDLHH